MARRTTKREAPPPPPPKTLAERYRDALENLDFYKQDLLRSLERERGHLRSHCSKLAESNHPQNEMEWGDKIFSTSAQISALELVRYWHEEGLTWLQIRERVLEEHILNDIRSTSKSTSQSHNLAVDAAREAFYDLYRRDLLYLAKLEGKISSLAFELQAELATKLTTDMAAALGACA